MGRFLWNSTPNYHSSCIHVHFEGLLEMGKSIGIWKGKNMDKYIGEKEKHRQVYKQKYGYIC